MFKYRFEMFSRQLLLLVLLVMFSFSSSLSVAAENAGPAFVSDAEIDAAFDALDSRLEKLSAEALKYAAKPRGLVALLKAEEMRQEVPHPQKLYNTYAKLLKSRKASFEIKLAALWGLQRKTIAEGNLETVEKAVEDLGLLRRWAVIGPFDNEGGLGHDRQFPPELEFDKNAIYKGKIRDVNWRELPDVIGPSGWVGFSNFFEPDSNASAYAYTEFDSKRASRVVFWLASAGAVKVWINDRLQLDLNVDRDGALWQDAFVSRLKKGRNRVLVKVNTKNGKWGFRLGMLDKKARKLRGIKGLSHVEGQLPLLPEKKRTWISKSKFAKRMPLAIRRLEKKFNKKKRVKTALMLAYLYRYFNSFDRELRLDEERISTALERSPDNIDALLLAAGIFRDHNKRFECLLKAREIEPENGSVALALADLYRKQDLQMEAFRLYDQARKDPLTFINALVGLTRMNNRFDNGVAALDDLRRVASRNDAPLLLLFRLSKQESRLGNKEEVYKLKKRIFDFSNYALDTGRWLMDYHRKRGERERTLFYLNWIQAVRPSNVDDWNRRGRYLEGWGDEDKALKAYETALRICPENVRAIKRMALFLQRRGDSARALDLYNRSLAVFPQDPELKQYLEILAPGKDGLEVEFARDALELIQKYPEQPSLDYHAEELLDSSAYRVFDNGLSTSYHQRVVRVLSESGIREFESFWVGYSPSREDVKILKARVIKPDGSIVEQARTSDRSLSQAYRIYYDNRAMRIYFPNLEPGDVIELSWRMDDIALDNLFADYFGKLRLLQGPAPIREQQVAVIMPKGRKLYYNNPQLAPEPQINQRDGEELYTWSVKDAPRIKREQAMPPMIEVADYLHVSTFSDYTQMGEWYWGLVEDQLLAKEDLRRKARELAENSDSVEDKVKSIYNWVVTKTRYVGLEFGVHGYKPYQVNQIFERKFGDCKDKASLLVVMLQEVGVDAQLVIIRTGNMGLLKPYPASLASFNHAIAYVPELNLYLDGTAEFTGLSELPWQDYRALLMRLSKAKVGVGQAPEQEYRNNVYRERDIFSVGVADDVKFSGSVSIKGFDAPRFRSHFQDEMKREEKLEKLLNKEYPGTKVEAFEFKGLEEFGTQVEIDYKAVLPGYARSEGEQKIVRLSFNKVDLVKRFAALSERTHPVYIRKLKDLDVVMEYRAEAGLKLKSLPEAVKLDNEYASFELATTAKGNDAQVVMKLAFKKQIVPLVDYPAFREFCQEVTKAMAQNIRWRHEK